MGKIETKSKKKKKSLSSSSPSRLYCSKMVASLLDKLIQDELSKVKKHPNTVAKWLGKMRASILKKISLATPLLFKTEDHDLATLDARLKENLVAINDSKAKIISSSQKMWQQNFEIIEKKTNDRLKMNRKGTTHNVENKVFSEKVTKLNENIDLMASQLSTLSKEVESRVVSFKKSIQAAEKLYSSNPLQVRAGGGDGSQRPKRTRHIQGTHDDSPSKSTRSSKNRAYKELDSHLGTI